MSDRIKRFTGSAFIFISILFCIVPVIITQHREENRFRSIECLQCVTEAVSPESGGTVRINTASAEELSELPGIGETLASLIVEERDRNGRFFYAEDLESVKGIGPRTLEHFRDMIDFSSGESEE